MGVPGPINNDVRLVAKIRVAAVGRHIVDDDEAANAQPAVMTQEFGEVRNLVRTGTNTVTLVDPGRSRSGVINSKLGSGEWTAGK